MYTMYEIILIQNDGELIDYLISVIKCLLNVYCKFMKTNLQVNLATYITNGAKLGVAAVARAPPLESLYVQNVCMVKNVAYDFNNFRDTYIHTTQ